MLENETNLTEETAAAMRELARTVTYAPPLRLAPRPQERVIRRAPRRWHQWATPLTAMAAVIVLAVSLVAIRDISNGRVAPPARPSPAAEGGGPATASPGGTAVTTAPTVARTRASAPATTTSPATSTAPTPTTSITFVPMQTATGGEFLTPSGNIECQIDSQAGQAGAYCQTTTPARLVDAVREAVERRNPDADISFIDTVCHPTKDHQKALERLMDEVEAMVVVGGANSNNTRQLVLRCQERGLPAYHVRGPEDLRPEWFDGVEIVGLTAGTSTLDATIAAVERALQQLPVCV